MLHSARRGHPRTSPGVARRDRGRRLFLAAREIESRGGALSGSRERLHRGDDERHQAVRGRALRRDAGAHQADRSHRSRAARRLSLLCAHRRGQAVSHSVPPQGQHGGAGRGAARSQRTGRTRTPSWASAISRSATIRTCWPTPSISPASASTRCTSRICAPARRCPDTAERVTSVAWAADNRTLFFTTEDETTKRSDKLWRHALGDAAFEQLYDEKDELYDIGVEKTRDRKIIVLGIESKDTSECRYLRADRPQGQFRGVPAAREEASVLHRPSRETDSSSAPIKRRPQFRSDDGAGERSGPRTLEDVRGARRQRADSGYRPVPRFRRGDRADRGHRPAARLRFREQGPGRQIAFPEPVYAASPGGTPDYDSSTYRYNYQSFITPPSVYDYDVQVRAIHAAQATGSAGRLRSVPVCIGTPLGHGARWRESSDLDRL